MASENVKALRVFYQKFFNEGIETAFDDLAHEEYHHNGKMKGNKGEGLKNWLQKKRSELEINVNITVEIDNGDFVGIYWATNSVKRDTGERIDPKFGINLYQFKDGKVYHNWQVRTK